MDGGEERVGGREQVASKLEASVGRAARRAEAEGGDGGHLVLPSDRLEHRGLARQVAANKTMSIATRMSAGG